MPTNLPPKYYDVEQKLKTAVTPEEKIEIMDEMLSIIPKHKGTEKLRASLKTKIAKQKNAAQKKSATAKHGPSYKVKKSGAGQVIIIGPPNAGKSMLVKALTHIDARVDEAPFTTFEPYPAMMPYKDIQIQLVDTPPITPEYMETWYPDLVKAADAAIMLIDPLAVAPDPIDALRCIFDKLTAKKIEFIEDCGEAVPEHGWVCKKTLVVANKYDLPDTAENLDILQELLEIDFKVIPVSANTGHGLEALKERIYSMLNIIRVYSKIPGKKADLKDPFTLKKGSTVMDMARAVHKDFSEKLQFARIWSKTAYDGQRVNRRHILEDEDLIELHM